MGAARPPMGRVRGTAGASRQGGGGRRDPSARTGRDARCSAVDGWSRPTVPATGWAHASRPGPPAHRSRGRAGRRRSRSPTPGPDDVLIEVHSVGISFPDLLLSKGRVPDAARAAVHPRRRRRRDRGLDRAAAGLEPGSPGRRGRAVRRRPASGRSIPAASVFPLPDRLSYDEGAALPMNYLTALFALQERGQVRDRARRSWSTARPAASVRRPSRWPRGSAPGPSASSRTEEKAAFARAAGADETVLVDGSRTRSRS